MRAGAAGGGGVGGHDGLGRPAAPAGNRRRAAAEKGRRAAPLRIIRVTHVAAMRENGGGTHASHWPSGCLGQTVGDRSQTVTTKLT